MSLDSASYAFHRTSNFESELEELFDQVKRMIRMGNKNDAIDLLNANYEMVKERLNANTKGIEEAAILDVLALGYLAVGDFKFVASLLNVVFFLPSRLCILQSFWYLIQLHLRLFASRVN